MGNEYQERSKRILATTTMKYGLFIAAICLLCHSCIHKQADDGVYGAVVYYRDSVSDTYKQCAAQFLIDNMDAHYTLQSEGIFTYEDGEQVWW